MLFQTIGEFAVTRRAAFEARSRWLCRDLRRDPAGHYVSRRTRRAWIHWLRKHPHYDVINAMWGASGRPGTTFNRYDRNYEWAVLDYADSLYPLDTEADGQRRIELAASCGRQSDRMRAYWRAHPCARLGARPCTP